MRMRSHLARMPQIGKEWPNNRDGPRHDVAQGGTEEERVEALVKLKRLLDSGVLTEEQYAAEKQKIQRRA